jgi:hypothetical protein
MGWRQLVLHNLGWKIAAVALAATLWFTLRPRTEKPYQPPSLATGFPSSRSTRELLRQPVYVLTSAPSTNPDPFKVEPREVDVTLSGHKTVLRGLSGRDLFAFVDLTDRKGAEVTTNLVRVYAPPEVTVEQVTPAKVRVERIQP